MKIVPPNEIPNTSEIVNTPTESLIKLFAAFQEMKLLCIDDNGIGLSAVQVGIPWKAFVALYPEQGEARYLIDCEYEGLGDKVDSVEGCLSLKDSSGNLQRYLVSRFEKIRIKGKELLTEGNLSLSDVDEEIEGYYAIVYQHEIDHHRGVLISDIGQEIAAWQ
jgi:peptide deformylase